MQRTNQPELLDILDASYRSGVNTAELAENLADIARLNRLTGTASWICRAIWSLVPSGVNRATILDVGAGAADVPVAVQRAAIRRGLTVRMVVVDRHPGVLSSIRQSVAAVRADAVRLPVVDGGIDVLICSQMLHHLSPPEVSAALREFARVTRWGFVLFDVERSWLAISTVRVLTWATSRNRLTRHDGPLSFRRAYRRAEMQGLACEAGLNTHALSMSAAFPFRWLGIYRQASAKGMF